MAIKNGRAIFFGSVEPTNGIKFAELLFYRFRFQISS